MGSALLTTGVQFPDNTVQTTAATAGTYVGARGQIFTSSGTFTVPTGVSALKVRLCGGGGSGSVSGGGGGAGGTSLAYLTGLTPGASITVTIGAGGSGVSGGITNGNSGGTTSFGSHFYATGGGGGNSANSGYSGGSGGNGVGGSINIPGMSGISGVYIDPNNRPGFGAGGNAYNFGELSFGAGVYTRPAIGGNGTATSSPVGYGVGSDGAYEGGSTSTGGSGICIVEW